MYELIIISRSIRSEMISHDSQIIIPQNPSSSAECFLNPFLINHPTIDAVNAEHRCVILSKASRRRNAKDRCDAINMSSTSLNCKLFKSRRNKLHRIHYQCHSHDFGLICWWGLISHFDVSGYKETIGAFAMRPKSECLKNRRRSKMLLNWFSEFNFNS